MSEDAVLDALVASLMAEPSVAGVDVLLDALLEQGCITADPAVLRPALPFDLRLSLLADDTPQRVLRFTAYAWARSRLGRGKLTIGLHRCDPDLQGRERTRDLGDGVRIFTPGPPIEDTELAFRGYERHQVNPAEWSVSGRGIVNTNGLSFGSCEEGSHVAFFLAVGLDGRVILSSPLSEPLRFSIDDLVLIMPGMLRMGYDDVPAPPPPPARCGRDGCANPAAASPHSCPYASEIGGDDREDYCVCCRDCTRECAAEI